MVHLHSDKGREQHTVACSRQSDPSTCASDSQVRVSLPLTEYDTRVPHQSTVDGSENALTPLATESRDTVREQAGGSDGCEREPGLLFTTHCGSLAPLFLVRANPELPFEALPES